LPKPEVLAQNDSWQRTVQRTEDSLFSWLQNALEQQWQLPGPLEGSGAIVLGILLAQQRFDKKREFVPEAVLSRWYQQPPWHTAESLQAALGKNWQTWANGKEPPLYIWLDLMGSAMVKRLTIAQEKLMFAQPELQTLLQELMAGKAEKLQTQLQRAWERAQTETARLSAFQRFQFLWSDFQTFQILAAVILGDINQQCHQGLQDWLSRQGPYEETTPILETRAALKQRFNRAVSIYQPRHPPLGETVQAWSKVLLTELLNSDENPAAKIWEILERARIGLASLTVKLPENWERTLGKALWSALRKTIDQLDSGYVPAEYEPWLPLEIWLFQIREWMSIQPPSVETCQQHLGSKEALVQPFFDPMQQRLRVLWLDQQSLALRDLPDDCALPHWGSSTAHAGVMADWSRGLEALRDAALRGTSSQPRNWEKVMQSPPVTQFATTLQNWATDSQLTQLTVIFPAPLAQLPWEALPELEECLVREVSLAHWLKGATQSVADGIPTQSVGTRINSWVVCDPSGEKQCMVKESQWVAQHFNVELEAPCASVFDALSRFSEHTHIHLSTHGQFIRYAPTRSALSLTQYQRLPLWTLTAIQTSAQLVMLSACESNLTGQDIEEVLTPIGIGPTVAAAGAQTVVGTLWSYNGVAALCFSYLFYRIAQENQNMPWHQVAARARYQLKTMTNNDLMKLAKAWRLIHNTDSCDDEIVRRKNKSLESQKPFEDLSMWAGFMVLGQVKR